MSPPKNCSRELDFFHFWKPLVRFFQFLCMLHYGIFRPELKNHRIKLTLHRIFLAISVSIQVISAYYLFLLEMEQRIRMVNRYNVSPVFMYVNVIISFSQLISFLLIPIETFCKRNTEQKLFETLQSIDDIFQKLNHSVVYRKHRYRQFRSTWLLFAGLTALMTINIYINDSIESLFDIWILLLYAYVFVVWRMRTFQIAFFINALRDLLGELKIVMRRHQHRLKYNSAQWNEIQYAQKIYSKIWLLKTMIGECFGYSMILFVTDSAVKMIVAGYWFYLRLGTTKAANIFLGKYPLQTTRDQFVSKFFLLLCYRSSIVHCSDSISVILHMLDIAKVP